MVICTTCDSRWEEHALPAVSYADGLCPLCGGALEDLDALAAQPAGPVHADVAEVLRAHVLGVGA
jgi:hypothetical protein